MRIIKAIKCPAAIREHRRGQVPEIFHKESLKVL